MSPTARSLAHCKKLGWLAQVVEQTIPRTFIKRDLFGCIDILALDGNPGVLGIQATSESGGNVAKRADRIRTECAEKSAAWLAAGNRIQVWGWGKKGAAGKRKLWTLRVVEVA